MSALRPADTILAFRSVRWSPLQRAHSQLPPPWRTWLLTEGSLTKRLIRASQGDFRIQILSQYWGPAWPSEQRALDLNSRQQVLIREIAMICRGEAWVVARTIIPPRTLSGPRRRLKSLGQTPLGRYLFRHRTLERSPLEIAPLSTNGDQIQSWGRRSIFYLSGRPLLVSEFFLPAILGAENPSPHTDA